MNAALQEALSFIAPAAKVLISSGVTAATAAIPKLSDEALNALETTVAPKLDVPAYFIALAKGENTQIEQVVDAAAINELELLAARAEALL